MSEEWDCPTCGRQVHPAMDYECSTCEMPASHHVSATELCKRIRALQAREASLIVRNKKLEDEANEQARLLGMSAERECDLRGKLERERANTIHTCHDQCQRPMCVLRRERDAERALADRLAEALKELLYYDLQDVNLGRLKSSREALAAWKEARND